MLNLQNGANEKKLRKSRIDIFERSEYKEWVSMKIHERTDTPIGYPKTVEDNKLAFLMPKLDAISNNLKILKSPRIHGLTQNFVLGRKNVETLFENVEQWIVSVVRESQNQNGKCDLIKSCHKLGDETLVIDFNVDENKILLYLFEEINIKAKIFSLLAKWGYEELITKYENIFTSKIENCARIEQ